MRERESRREVGIADGGFVAVGKRVRIRGSSRGDKSRPRESFMRIAVAATAAAAREVFCWMGSKDFKVPDDVDFLFGMNGWCNESLEENNGFVIRSYNMYFVEILKWRLKLLYIIIYDHPATLRQLNLTHSRAVTVGDVLAKLGLHDIARLILILYCLASIFKTTIYTNLYTVFDTISRLRTI